MGVEHADGLGPPQSPRPLVLQGLHGRRSRASEAKRKYFEHAGALLTADGTDDDLLIKLEGAPAGYKVVIPQLT